ncbi:hypothetical protein Taro_006134, partial [Colocasia esculenta]|nr:hypothetical protein [Colocasia esculenta]
PLRRRSFTEVRAAALRASGLAAACSTTPRTLDADHIPSFCSNLPSEEQDECVGLMKERGQFIDSRSCVPNLVVGIQNSDNCMQNGHTKQVKNKSGNLTVRKLNFEEAISRKYESTVKMMDNGNSDTPHSPVCIHFLSGLSYVDSQEPGEQSQADALDAVDKFLSINDVGLSQDANPRKPCVMMTPLVSSAKGTHCLAQMGRGSPVGKAGVFDWVDTLEDEGGGDFFFKRKDLFFGKSKHIKKSLTNPQSTINKMGKHEGVHPKTDTDKMNLTSLETRLNQDICRKTWVSQVPINNITCKEINGQLNEEPSMQQLQETHVERGEESVHDIGPDTQIAAEAMEALVCGPLFVGHEQQSAQPNTGNVVEGTNIRATRKKTSSSCMLQTKRGTTADIGGGSCSTRRSNRIKTLHMEANLHDSSSSKGSLTHLKLKRDQRKKETRDSEDGRIEKLLCKLKSTKCKLNGNSSESFGADKVHGKLQRSSTSVMVDAIDKQVSESAKAEMDECVKQIVESVSNELDSRASSLVLEDQVYFSKQVVHRGNSLCVTPVAHRTRKRKVYAAERLGTVSTYEETRKDSAEAKTIPANRKLARIVADATELLSDQGKGSSRMNISSEFDVQKVTTLPEKQCSRNALSGDIIVHRKQRTARKSKSGNNDQAVKPKDPSLPRHVTQAVGPCPLQQDNLTLFENANVRLKSVKDMLKLDSAISPSETDMTNAGVKGSLVASGVRTRSFVKSHPYTSERDSRQGLEGDISTGAGFFNLRHSTDMNEEHLQEVEHKGSLSSASFHVNHGIQLLSEVEDAKDDAKLLGDPKEKPSGSISIAQQKLRGSPVCTSMELLKVSQKRKGLSKALIARELIRLESPEAASSLGFKDLRRRRDITSIRVCFSHHLDDDIIKHQKKILVRLGVSIVTIVSDATHFIADKFVRTRNMLEAMAAGKPVVTHLWLESCGQASCFIDEKNYILRDARKEKEIGFSMPASLAHARQRPLLQGKRVFVTANVKPDMKLVADLAMAAQGQPIERLGRSAIKDDKLLDDLLVISCEEDFAICKPLLEKGAEVFSSELLLNGIVVQKLEYDRHRLFLDHVKRTRSSVWLRSENSNRFLSVTRCT